MLERSKLLRKIPAYLKGISSISIFGEELSNHPILERSDEDTIRSDWEMVGKDLRQAFDDFSKEISVS